MKELIRIGIATTETEIAELEEKTQAWIYKEQGGRHTRLDLFGEESAILEKEITATQQFLTNITYITLDFSLLHTLGILPQKLHKSFNNYSSGLNLNRI